MEEIENGFMLEIEKEIKDTCEVKKKLDIQFVNKMIQKREKLFEKQTEKNRRHFQKIIDDKDDQIYHINLDVSKLNDKYRKYEKVQKSD